MTSLVSLTALHITHPPGALDLSALTALQHLSLASYTSTSLSVTAPSVASVVLDMCDASDACLLATLPDMTSFLSLRHLLISVGRQDETFRIVLAAAKLPAQRIRVSVHCSPDQVSQSFDWRHVSNCNSWALLRFRGY